MRPLVGRHDIPHLGLAFRAVALPGQLVVGMHLDREVLARVDELDEQREFVAEAFAVLLAQQAGAVAGDELGERQAGVGALGHHRDVALHARELPAFADAGEVGGDLLVGCDLLAAPEQRFQNGSESIHGLCVVCAMDMQRYGFFRTALRCFAEPEIFVKFA